MVFCVLADVHESGPKSVKSYANSMSAQKKNIEVPKHFMAFFANFSDCSR